MKVFEAMLILEQRTKKLRMNHLIGSRAIANQEQLEIADTIDMCCYVIENALQRNKPIELKMINDGGTIQLVCPCCGCGGGNVKSWYRYCPKCGQALKEKQNE
jgi:hypothetical protein